MDFTWGPPPFNSAEYLNINHRHIQIASSDYTDLANGVHTSTVDSTCMFNAASVSAGLGGHSTPYFTSYPSNFPSFSSHYLAPFGLYNSYQLQPDLAPDFWYYTSPSNSIDGQDVLFLSGDSWVEGKSSHKSHCNSLTSAQLMSIRSTDRTLAQFVGNGSPKGGTVCDTSGPFMRILSPPAAQFARTL